MHRAAASSAQGCRRTDSAARAISHGKLTRAPAAAAAALETPSPLGPAEVAAAAAEVVAAAAAAARRLASSAGYASAGSLYSTHGAPG